MTIWNSFFQKIKNKFFRLRYKNKKFKSEEDFYTFLFTKNPSWNSKNANQDEIVRWEEIKKELAKITTSANNLEILEIGCGRGWMSNMMSEFGTVIGIDPIGPVIKYAQKLFPEIEFHKGVTSSYLSDFPSKKFDVIVSTEVIEHVVDKNKFLNEINFMLKPEGKLIITTPRLEHYEDSVKAFGFDPNQPIEDWLSSTQLKLLLEICGFKIISNTNFAPLPNLDKKVLITQMWVGEKI